MYAIEAERSAGARRRASDYDEWVTSSNRSSIESRASADGA